jgi:antitoxin HicB
MTMTAIQEISAAKDTSSLRKNKRHENSSRLEEDVRHYLQLDYPIELVHDDEVYVASNPDLPGCVSMGSSPNEAIDNLAEVRELWIEGQLRCGNPIPEPSKADRYSGKFVLRVPKMLHKLADFRARQEGVSLNSFIVAVLAGALGYPMLGAREPHRNKAKAASNQHRLHDLWFCDDQGAWAGQDWNIENPEITRSDFSHTIDPNFIIYAGSFAKRIGNHSKSTFRLPELEDYQSAEKTSCVKNR